MTPRRSGPFHRHVSPRRAAPAARMLAIGLALSLTACVPAVLNPQGPVGLAERSILADSLAIMLAIVVPTILAILGFAWWYRASNPRAHRRPDFTFSGQLELVVWSIPLLTIMLLGGVSWVASHELDPAVKLPSSQPPLDIQVVSLDWKWLFIYPGQHIASVNRLVVPSGTPIHFALTSASVMNAFFIPQLGSMIYTMNGMVDNLNLQADHVGAYRGMSSHYSGDGFSGMQFDVQAVTRDQFAAWVATTRASPAALDIRNYTSLARQSQDVAPITYGSVDPALFQDIVTEIVPPGPGPKPAISPKSEH